MSLSRSTIVVRSHVAGVFDRSAGGWLGPTTAFRNGGSRPQGRLAFFLNRWPNNACDG
jgi:hypothetical protein